MANRTLQVSFGGGEVSPEMYARFDDVKRQAGLAVCRNFMIKPHGAVENRAGTQFINSTKNQSKRSRLIPFTFSTTDTACIELGSGYFRFYINGQIFMDGGFPYEIGNPYNEADLFHIRYVQSADVLTLTHHNYQPMELRRISPFAWQLSAISFLPAIDAPLGISATPKVAGDIRYDYTVTSVKDDLSGGSTESSGGLSANCMGDLFETANTNTITWNSVTGADHYYVYKKRGGLYGYIGTTKSLSFVDDNIAPDMSKTPPLFDSDVLTASGKRPTAVSYYEQRRCFAGSLDEPQTFWATRSGTESDMAYSLPSRDDDRIAVRVAAREANSIQHILPLSNLMLLTSAAEWQVTGGNIITPSTISIRPQSYVGASHVTPVVVGNNALFCSARGGRVRELSYNWQAGGYVTGDICLRAAHLFDGDRVVDMAFQKNPYPVAWCVMESGKLLGLTYVPEQEVWAWHRHDTDGLFESCAVIPEGDEDVLYLLVQREVDGQTKRYIERMASRFIPSIKDSFFVDSGLTYDGSPATTFSGLEHLEGKTVSILADGSVEPQQVVTSGQIELDRPASVVHVGLPIEADLQTLPLSLQVDAALAQGRAKNINKVWIRVSQSSGIFAGPSVDRLTEVKQRTTEPYGTPANLKTDELSLVLTPDWSRNGTICIRQSDPLPLTIISLAADVALGG